MKKGIFILKLISILVVLGCIFYYQSIAAERSATVSENEAIIEEVEEYNKEIQRKMAEDEQKLKGEAKTKESGPYKDGLYKGESLGYGGIIKITVFVEEGFISSIEVTDHSGEDPAYYFLAESVISKIVETQSADVDTVSGATLSSSGLIQASKEALSRAEK